jgi:hypothetical protein
MRVAAKALTICTAPIFEQLGLGLPSGVLTGDPLTGVGVFSGQEGRRQELEGLSDRELLRKASRETLVVINLVCYVLRPQLPPLIATKTTETATLLNAIVAAFKAAREGLEQFEPDQPHHAVKASGKSDDPLAAVLNKFSKAAGQ